MKIKNIYLHNFRNDEHFQFIQFTLALVDETGAAALGAVAQNAALIALHRQEDEALKKILKSALTEEINDLDRERDIVFRGLVNAVGSGLSHYSAAVRNAAVRLEIVLDTYGNVAQKPHIEETSALYNLLNELLTNYSAEVETLALTGWIAELDRLNRAVEALIAGRADEGAARTSLVLKEVRAQVDAAYNALTAMVEAQALVSSLGTNAAEAAELYANFVRRLNERIDLMNSALAQRRGIAKAAAEKKKAEEEEIN
jgi:hypothetical protein